MENGRDQVPYFLKLKTPKQVFFVGKPTVQASLVNSIGSFSELSDLSCTLQIILIVQLNLNGYKHFVFPKCRCKDNTKILSKYFNCKFILMNVL